MNSLTERHGLDDLDLLKCNMWRISSRTAYRCAFSVVVSEEGVERAELRPARAELLCCRATESADIGSSEWDPKEPKG